MKWAQDPSQGGPLNVLWFQMRPTRCQRHLPVNPDKTPTLFPCCHPDAQEHKVLRLWLKQPLVTITPWLLPVAATPPQSQPSVLPECGQQVRQPHSRQDHRAPASALLLHLFLYQGRKHQQLLEEPNRSLGGHRKPVPLHARPERVPSWGNLGGYCATRRLGADWEGSRSVSEGRHPFAQALQQPGGERRGREGSSPGVTPTHRTPGG